jgi:hypothetical protein
VVSNIVGNTVQGEDFFDRERELERVLERLQTDNVLLLAPRRVGKTSLMYRVREKEKELGHLAAYLSVADVDTELQFVQKLYEAAQTWSPGQRAVKALAKGPLGRFMRRIKKLGVATVAVELADGAAGQWQELGAALARVLDKLDTRCILLVDELPIFVLSLLRQDTTGGRARTFLNWFRQLRLDPDASRHVRWLLAGSIGLDTVTQRVRLGDTINDLFLFNELGPFSREIADAFLAALGQSYGIHLTDEVKAHIRARLGWLIPFHLQLFFSKLRERTDGPRPRITLEDVDAVYEGLLTPANKGYFDYWEQRLTEELGPPDDRQALDLLNAVAKNPEGEPLRVLQGVLGARLQDPEQRDRQLRYLVDVLQSDGYLVLEGERYRFRSALLRDFWSRRILP